MSGHQDLLHEVFECKACPEALGFTRLAKGQPYLKFPPTIGAVGKAPLLFVGIHPRLAPDNQAFYQRILRSEQEFASFAENSYRGKPYIGPECKDGDYRPHMQVVQKIFGRTAAFEDCAAVTQLFFCGKIDAKGLKLSASSCADKYFERVFLKVRPKIVFCVCPPAMAYFQRLAKAEGKKIFFLTLAEHTAVVVEMPR